MPGAASSNCPSLRLSTLASPGVQLSCEGDQTLLNPLGSHHDRWSLGRSAEKVTGRGVVSLGLGKCWLSSRSGDHTTCTNSTLEPPGRLSKA